jgi:dienelactone hydrolase
LDKTKFEGVLVYEEGGKPKPGLVLVPNWLGVTDANVKQAELIAARGYTVFVADTYVNVDPTAEEIAEIYPGFARSLSASACSEIRRPSRRPPLARPPSCSPIPMRASNGLPRSSS